MSLGGRRGEEVAPSLLPKEDVLFRNTEAYDHWQRPRSASLAEHERPLLLDLRS